MSKINYNTTLENSLDFCVSKETNGSFISLFPEVPGSKSKRIIVLDRGVEVDSQSFQIGLRRLQLCRSRLGAWAGEGSGRRNGGKEDGCGGLHCRVLYRVVVVVNSLVEINEDDAKGPKG